MATLAELLLEHGIRPRSYREGGQKLLCPKCSHQRKHHTDPCLSLTIEGDDAVWKCHHCEWSGAVSKRDSTADDRRSPRSSRRPARPKQGPGELTPAVLRWLAARGISETVARRNRIGSARFYIPALKAEVNCIAFPYFRDGELVNIKFRALAEKAFAQVKDAEKILFGLEESPTSRRASSSKASPTSWRLRRPVSVT
jgi:twinkle protein